MEVLTMLKFWKSISNPVKPTTPTTTIYTENFHNSAISDYFTDESDDDDDDSYFELELTPPSPFSTTINQQQKEKPQPQSPISIIPPVPSQKLFKNVIIMMLKRSKNRVEDFSDIDSVSSFSSPKRFRNDLMECETESFTVKFNMEDGSIVPKLTRTRSRSTSTSPKIERRNGDVSTSKRFSKDTVQKYLNNVIKPKSSLKEKYNNGGNSSPLRKGKEEKQSGFFKVKCKKLGKSKSDSAMIGVGVSSPMRHDVVADGIEGAILHCKLSLTSSTKGCSSLSRCSSDPSH